MSKREKKIIKKMVKEVVGGVVIAILLVGIIMMPKIKDSYCIDHAQAKINAKAPYGMTTSVDSYFVEYGDSVKSISNTLEKSWGQQYGVSSDEIYYWILSVNGYDDPIEASEIKAGYSIFVPTYVTK